MGIADFLAGRSNKLLRDMLAASAAVALCCVGTATMIRAAAENFRAARQPMPARLEANRPPSSGAVVTVTRSVLDDPIVTGSISGRPIVLDPCTGKTKN